MQARIDALTEQMQQTDDLGEQTRLLQEIWRIEEAAEASGKDDRGDVPEPGNRLGFFDGMTIFTPSGLKIRLPACYVFALAARLYPRVDAFRLLKTTEGIELIPSVEVLCIAIVCCLTGAPPLAMAGLVCGARVWGTLNTLRGVHFGSGILIPLGTVFAYVDHFGFSTIAASILALAAGGWYMVAAYFAGRVIGSLLSVAIEYADTGVSYRQCGVPLTASEWHFLAAYMLHAERVGVSTNPAVSEAELKDYKLLWVYMDLASKWPEVVDRFTIAMP